MTLKSTISALFKIAAAKKVSKTDKSKQAFVLSSNQVSVFQAAGISHSTKTPADTIKIIVLGDPDRTSVNATYYHSMREGSKRPPEPRIGTQIISSWLVEGDELLLATDGIEVYAMKLNKNEYAGKPTGVIKREVISSLSDDFVVSRAKLAPRKSRKTKYKTEVYTRDPYIIEAAKRRAAGMCEMLGCTYIAFLNENKKPYLEGHHVKPLSEGGDDAIDNVAALCPRCHREQHHAIDKLDKRKILQNELDKIIRESK